MDRAITAHEIRQRRLRRLAAALAVAASLVAAGWLLLSLARPSVSAAAIRTAVVEEGPVEAATLCSGTVVPELEQVVPCPFTSRVMTLVLQPGAAVEAGDALLTLDDTDARLAVERLEDQAALVANRRHEAELELERRLRQLDGSIEIQRARLAFMHTKTARQQSLRELGLSSSHELEQAALDEGIAAVELRQLEDSVRTEREASQAKIEGLAIEASLLARDLAEQRHRLEQATVRADRRGVLTAVGARAGATVVEGEELARVADLSRFRVEASLSDLHAGRIAVGMPARVVVGELSLDGVVHSVPPAIDDGVMTVIVELSDPASPALKPNRRADVYIITESREHALRVPRGPFLNGTGLQRVFVVSDDGWARRVETRIGVAGVDHYEVLDGLAAGDRVVVSGLSDRLDLERVRIR